MHKQSKILKITLLFASLCLARGAYSQSGLSVPANVTSKTISSTQIDVYWAQNVVNETGYRVERKTGGGEFAQVAELGVDQWEYKDTGLSPLTRYTYRVYAFNNATTSGLSNEAVSTTLDGPAVENPVVTPPVDPGNTPTAVPTTPDTESFDVLDVGSKDLRSSASYDSVSDTFKLSASGGQVWGQQDDFNYVYREVTGDVEATVKVSSIQGLDPSAKAGIMFRQSPHQDSVHTFLTASVGKGVALERRHQIGGGTTRSGKGSVEAPVWLRLVRKGSYISAYYSEDQHNWSFLAEDSISFSDTIYIGLAVAAQEHGQTVEADFGELEIVDLGSAPISQIYISADIGKVGVNGDAAFDTQSGLYLVEASGGDIGHRQDAFHYVYRELMGDFEGVVQLDSLVAEEDWAKAGLMIRGDIQPDAPYFSLFIAKNVGVVYQSRTSSGADSNWSMKDGIVDPVWLKLKRVGNQFQAFYSTNGTDWTLQDEITINLSETVLFGMALTSHKEGALAFAEYSNLGTNEAFTPSTGGGNNGGGSTGGGVITTSDPVAAFSRATTGQNSLGVSVDASDSNAGGGTIVSYDWDWGDGTPHGTGAQANHTYGSDGIYLIKLSIQDDKGVTSTTSHTVQVTSASLPGTDMTIRELGYSHVGLTWKDNASWDNPWLIQRSTIASFIEPTDLTNNQDSDNTGAGTFRWLGVNADNFVDIDGIEEGTTYYWRVATVTNLSEHYRNGSTPQFGNWIYGTATTKTLAASKKAIYNVTNYGAVANDGQNDYPAAKAALAAAEAAGGGIIYFPAGTYDIWPTDGDVKIVNGIPTLEKGKSAGSTLFQIRSNNITFLGDASGAPTTFWNLYLWGKTPATKWLEVKDGGGKTVNARRYFVFKPYDVAQTTVKNIDVDMGAPPVNTGKEWYNLDQKRYEWDISHKLWSAHDTTRGKNTIFENVRARNCRGEILYVGGSSEKFLIKNCILERSNSSSISMSADAEIVNTIVRDSSNASVESILISTRAGLDGKPFPQNHIARGCTFVGLDQSSKGFMKNLPGKKTFSGWHVFNAEGTYQTVTDSVFTDCINNSFGPWYEYRDGMRFNCTFNAVPDGYSGQSIFTWTSSQPDYLLDGGMSHVLWMGDTVNIARNWPKSAPFFYSQPGGAANGSESPWIWDAVHFKNTGGGSYQVGMVWLDTASQSNARQDVVFKNWTSDAGISFGSDSLTFLHGSRVDPTYINFLNK